MSAVQAIKSFRFKQLKELKKPFPILVSPAEQSTTPTTLRLRNPFVPQLNTRTGRWVPAAVSLRRQADLVKLAKASNTLHLLPPGAKVPRPTLGDAEAVEVLRRTEISSKKSLKPFKAKLEAEWTKDIEWVGKAEFKEVAGADLGTRLYAAKKRMFKGHRWERMRAERESKQKILLRDMARRVRNYKAVRLFTLLFQTNLSSLFSNDSL